AARQAQGGQSQQRQNPYTYGQHERKLQQIHGKVGRQLTERQVSEAEAHAAQPQQGAVGLFTLEGVGHRQHYEKHAEDQPGRHVVLGGAGLASGLAAGQQFLLVELAGGAGGDQGQLAFQRQRLVEIAGVLQVGHQPGLRHGDLQGAAQLLTGGGIGTRRQDQAQRSGAILQQAVGKVLGQGYARPFAGRALGQAQPATAELGLQGGGEEAA